MCIGCENNEPNFKHVVTTCRVCELIDNDLTPKPVDYCDFCKAYICEPCWTNPIRRAEAALLNFMKPTT